LLKEYAEAIKEVAKLSAQREPLETAMKARQAEYEKSMNKYPDFPSIPEQQNRLRVKYDEKLSKLDAKIREAQSEVDRIAECLEQAIQPSPAQNNACDAKVAGPAVSLQQQEAIKKLETENSQLKMRLGKIEVERLQERAELRSEFDQKLAELKKQMEETVRATKKDLMKEFRTVKGMKEEVLAEMKEQVAAVRGDFEKRQTEQTQFQRNELQSQFSKHKEEVEKAAEKRQSEQAKNLRNEVQSYLSKHKEEAEKWQAEVAKTQRNDQQSQLSEHKDRVEKAVEKQLLAHRNGPDIASRNEISTLIEEKISTWKPDASDLLSRVDKLTGDLARNAQDAINLRNDLTACTQRVEEEAQKVDEHESKLSNLDIEELQRVLEVMSVGFPALETKVAAIQVKVDGVPNDMETRHQQLFDLVKKFVTGMATELAQTVDGVQNTVKDYGPRIAALEKALAGGAPPLTAGIENASADALPSTNPDMASIRSDCDSTKAAVDRLTQEHAELSLKIDQATQDIAAAKVDTNQQLDQVRLSIKVIDTQINNLSTRSLAEHIIGVLEQLYPNSHQLVADIGGLKTLVDRLGSRLDGLEGRVQDFKGKVDSFVGSGSSTKLDPADAPAAAAFDAAAIASMQERLLKDIGETSRKRKRVDQANGAEHPTGTNGTG
jgi:chromosome segregation ATPase